MSEDDREWLTRLTSDEWLRAARNDLARAYAALEAKRHREGLTYARRAAGMALNAMLCARFDEKYGRSYMQHVVALAADEAAPEDVRAAARRLVDTPIRTDIVPLGPGKVDLADDAAAIVSWVSERPATSSQ